MIRAVITNEMLDRLLAIERAKAHFGDVRVPVVLSNRLRKSSKKKSSYASNRIEGNPLTEAQSDSVIDGPARRHYLKPEQEIKNYFDALNFLEGKIKRKASLTKDLVLAVQKLVVRGESAEKSGFRGPMPPGVLFAVYDDATGVAEYIPPEAKDVEPLVDELMAYVDKSDDHPVIKAAIVHYQLVTIHPFEDGNGRTARLISDYVLDLGGYGFNQIGSLEEYFAYDIDEYYRSLQMGLPPLYYDGRENPPHPEIWLSYFVRMMEMHANRALELVSDSAGRQSEAGSSFLNVKERRFLEYLVRKRIAVFAPGELARPLKVTNRTIVNWCAALVRNGFLLPDTSGQRIRTYEVTDLARESVGSNGRGRDD